MKKAKMMTAVAAFGASLCAQAAFVYTNEAPNGVGDVVALTNALARYNALSNNARFDARIYLKPGVYNLKDVYMNAASHLVLNSSQGGVVCWTW